MNALKKFNTVSIDKLLAPSLPPSVCPIEGPICPIEGEFIGYKKCMVVKEGEILFVIVTLKIPADALRVSPFRNVHIGILIDYFETERSRKCRCSYAKVIKIESFDGKKQYQSAVSLFANNKLTYKVGEYVCADEFDDDITEECSHGIHFFMTRKEAEEYMCY